MSRLFFIFFNFFFRGMATWIPRLFFLTAKAREGTQRDKATKKYFNQKLLEVQEPFLEKVPGRRRQNSWCQGEKGT